MKSVRPSKLVPSLCLLAILSFVLAVPASAQPDFHLGARAGVADLSGSGIYDRLGSSLTPIGIQGEVRWPAFSLRLAYEQADTDGRLFLPDTPGINTVPLGADLDLDLFHLTAAYNAEPSGTSWSWFAGGGPSFAQADLTTRVRFSQGPVVVNATDESDADSVGLHAVGGVRYALTQNWELGGELMYLQLAELLDFGVGSSSESDDLDGFSAMVSVSYGF